MEIEGKTVLITGAARIGAEVAEMLARRGAKTALLYRRSREEAERTAARIQDAGGEAITLQADLAHPEEIQNAVDQAATHFGRLDALINMASMYRMMRWDELDAKAWDEAIQVEARGAYLTSIAAAGHMKKQGAGRIVNFSDWLCASGRPRYQSYLPYYAGKMAVLGLTQALALELAPRILVNAIAPGPILAPPDLGEKEDAEVRRQTPLGRWGGPGEIAKTVAFLIETDFITGECIRVDGGRHLK